MQTSWIIQGGRVVDPSTGRDGARDLFIENGILVDRAPRNATVIDATGFVTVPGLVDLHVHLREPGGEEAETIDSGSRAAARGGFTSIVAMPNTKPSYDTPDRVAWVAAKGREAGHCEVIPSGAITLERKGRELTDFAGMKAAGAGALTDDGSTVQDDAVMEAAMRKAASLGMVIMDHAQDNLIERQGGVMHEGVVSKRLGLPGIPTSAETRIIGRDILLAEKTGCALHIQHVTSGEGAALIRTGRARGVRVTGELTPHHLALCDEDIDPDNTSFKMNPPLRSRQDREALIDASCDGTLCCFATDHAPHPAEKKARGFLKAPFGLVGLETAIGVTYTRLVLSGRMTLMDWLKRWTTAPSAVLGRKAPALAPGCEASLAILDLSTPWVVNTSDFLTKSRNSPFEGWTLTGRSTFTMLRGLTTWSDGRLG